MKPEPLPDEAIARALLALPGWARDGSEIVRTFDRGNFDGSIAFVNAIAAAANAANHHPDLALSWNSVTVRLSSHDAGGLTDRDFRLAREIDLIANARSE
jgi:4a-hydroxytetrahydrobiopterin dehydratase